MVDVNELKDWIAYAEEDLGSAKLLLKAKKPFFSAACFHAQQCEAQRSESNSTGDSHPLREASGCLFLCRVILNEKVPIHLHFNPNEALISARMEICPALSGPSSNVDDSPPAGATFCTTF